MSLFRKSQSPSNVRNNAFDTNYVSVINFLEEISGDLYLYDTDHDIYDGVGYKSFAYQLHSPHFYAGLKYDSGVSFYVYQDDGVTDIYEVNGIKFRNLRHAQIAAMISEKYLTQPAIKKFYNYLHSNGLE